MFQKKKKILTIMNCLSSNYHSKLKDKTSILFSKEQKQREKKKPCIWSVFCPQDKIEFAYFLWLFTTSLLHMWSTDQQKQHPRPCWKCRWWALPLGTSWVRICIQATVPGDSGLRNTGFVWMDGFLSHRLISLRASLVAQTVKRLPAVWETWVWSLG